MAVGKQDETTIVHWHPGEADGTNGLGVGGTALPANEDAGDTVVASGVYNTLDARIDAANTRVSTLSARVVASGVLPVGV